MPNPFFFFLEISLVELLGKKASSIKELLAGIISVPGSSIYYHTHRFLKQHHFLSPEPPNDFAYWTTNVYGDEKLGEKLSAVDTVQFKTIRELREQFVQIISNYLKENKDDFRVSNGYEFHFMKSRSFVIKTNHSANNLSVFLEKIKIIDPFSLYFHIFEAKIRLEKDDNDFSYWLSSELQENDLARKISQLDPYTITLEGLRKKIIRLIEARLNNEA